MQVTFKVYRKDPEKDGKPGRSNYTVEVPEGATILDGLLKIRDEMDGTLAFRASCLRGYCGECLIRVNNSARFACIAKVSAFTQKGPEISLDPLRNIPVLKDLVFDMDAFMWNKIKAVKPWLEAKETASDGENIIPDAKLKDLRKVMSCYHCGMCDEGCTVLPVDFNFLGPAALTKAYRFVFDPRDKENRERFKILEQPKGIWDCVHCFEADEHCPRGIEPTKRIIALRDFAFRLGITNEKVARHHKSFAASVKESGWLDEGRLAVESEGLTNISGLMKLLPTAAKALVRGKAPIPYLHAKRPGADKIKRIFEKGEQEKK
ncbi:MAG: succinate dehydrogenase/fumarate reductase iron-sulfur subunit [Candidatus Binatia bacterium]